jgi:hypothetical protein
MSDETAVTRIAEMCRNVDHALAGQTIFDPADYWTQFARALLASGVVVLPKDDTLFRLLLVGIRNGGVNIDRTTLLNALDGALKAIAHRQAEGAGT